MKTIFWDFNGTIIDDLDLCLTILNEMLAQEGKPAVTKEQYLDIFTFPIKDYYQLAGFDFNQTSFDVLAKRFIKEYQPRSLVDVKLHDDVVETIKQLKKLGYNQVVLSASQTDNLVEQLKHFEILDLFDNVLGTSDIYAKSKLEIGLGYLKSNQIDLNKSFMIGDTLHDLKVAKALNCGIILYTRGHQSKLRFNGCRTIDSFKELVKEIVYEK